MSIVRNLPALILFFVCLCIQSVTGQGTVYSILAGPSLSTQSVNGFQKEPFVRLHVKAVMESSSDISPNSAYLSLGYHTKGSAVRTFGYYDPNTGQNRPSQSSAMEFHNLSFTAGVKQRKEVGETFLSYGLGARLDYNISTDFDAFFAGLQGAKNQFTYGLSFDIGWEFPLSELVSTTVEIGFSPDLSSQIYIPAQNTGYTDANGNEIIIQETDMKNVVFEARAGFRFWRKVEYID